MKRLILVGCVEAKALPVAEQPDLAPRIPAQDLYVSPLFRKRRGYAEREVAAGRAYRWAIISALHRTVEPERPLAAYDWTMSDWRKAELAGWGEQVAYGVQRLVCAQGCISCRCLRGWTVEVHAGAAYVDPIRWPLLGLGADVETPLAGLGIGEQLHWYTARLDPQLELWPSASK
jgi:hypothetical protein